MKTFPSRLWSKRPVRGVVWTLVTLFTLGVLVVYFLDWQGHRQREEIRAILEKEGETLDFRAILPAPIPDESNFCATPALHRIADEKMGKANREALAIFDLKARAGGTLPPALEASAQTGRRPDLAPWIKALTKSDHGDATTLLAALADQEPVLAELTAALNRPGARWTPQWSERELPAFLLAIPLPHYQSSQDIARTLALRGLAEAEGGDAAAAHASARKLLRLAEASTGDPLLIGLMVGMSQAGLASNGVWSLCESRNGTAEDFARLEADLARIDLEEATRLALRGEMAASVSSIEALAETRHWTETERENLLGTTEMSKAHLLPRGLLRQNATAIARLHWTYGLKPLKESGLTMQEGAGDLRREIEELRKSPLKRPGSFLATLSVPAFSVVIPKAIHTQTLIVQARLACALERYFAVHQSYPDSLKALGDVPATDLWTGEVMHYERTPEGRYRLWSVGPDRIDNGGKRTFDPEDPDKIRFHTPSYLGDWVWDYAG